MSVIAVFRYRVAEGRMGEFMAKLGKASGPQFDSEAMPLDVLVTKSQSNGEVVLLIEYTDMTAYEARTAYERGNPEWVKLFAPNPKSPEQLLSVELLSEL